MPLIQRRPLLFVFSCLLAAPALVAAQSRQEGGQVHVRLAGAADAPVTVTPVAEPPVRVDHTVMFRAVTPGTYTITVGARSRTVQVNPREIVVLADGDTLDVVDRQSLGEGFHVTDRWFTDPASARDVWTLIETIAPYVIADRMDNGGLGTGRTAFLGSRGSSWTTTRMTFGGTTLIGPNLHGLMPFGLDLAAVGSASILSGQAPVEIGTPGVVVALTPRAPSKSRSGSFDLSLTTPRMVTRNALPHAPSIQRTDNAHEGNVLVEGPLGSRSELLLSASRSRIQFYERDRPALWTSTATSLFAHVIWRASDNNQLRAIATVQHVSAPFEDRRQFRDRAVNENGLFAQLSATWDRTLTSGAHVETSAGFHRGAFRPDAANATGGTMDRVWDGYVPTPAADVTTTQWELNSTLHLAPWPWRGARHDVRVGGTLRRAGQTSVFARAVDIAEVVAGLPARVWRPASSSGDSQRAILEGAAFVANRMAFGNNLTVEAGVRAEVTRGSIRGALQGVSWETMSPRVSAQWHYGPLAIFAAAGRYTDPLSLMQLRHGDPGETTMNVHRWTDPDGNGQFAPSEAGVLLWRAGRNDAIASIDPELKAPRTTELTTGAEMRVGQHFSIRTALIWRYMRSMLGSVNTGVTAASYDQQLIPDAGGDWDGPSDDMFLIVYDRRPEAFGLDRYQLTNPEDATAKYEGLETTWSLRTQPAELHFGAMAYRTRSWAGHLGFGPLENDPAVLGEVFERPNARPLHQGSYFFDRSYVGKLSGSVRLPLDLRWGFAARYQDGQPFSRIVVATGLRTGPEMIHAYRVARTRYTYTLTLDMRLQKSFTVAGHTAAVRLDVFNATQHTNEVEENALTTPIFRLSTAVQPPLTFRLGLRYSW